MRKTIGTITTAVGLLVTVSEGATILPQLIGMAVMFIGYTILKSTDIFAKEERV